tara:strand:+ start:4139 stop:5725 length:1587 start_codon:yes stop_codon:yes gene_type:complete
MPGKLISLYCKDKLILSENASTSGEHTGLDFIPGSTLLGAVAAKLYRKLTNQQDQWLVFHSGKIRFGNMYPTTAPNVRSWPMPLSFHYIKNTQAIENGRLTQVLDLSTSIDEQQSGQRKQMRAGYITEQGNVVNTVASYQLKSAINYATGTAQESQLFGYSTIESDQWFCGELTWDEDVATNHPELLSQIIQTLTSSRLRIGRSKGAEFGRVNAHVSELSDCSPLPDNLNSSFRLFCLSDVALRNEQGDATLSISVKSLGLDGLATFDTEHSFVRPRRYSPYNSARRSYDQERVVIAKGSVLTFKIEDEKSALTPALKNILSHGVGLYREMGLGQIRLELQPLNSQRPDFSAAPHLGDDEEETPDDSALLLWLKQRAGQESLHSKAEVFAKLFSAQLLEQYKNGRTIAGASNENPWGPSKSAWGQVLDQAKLAKNDEQLLQLLFTGNSPLISSRSGGKIKQDDPWQNETVNDKGKFISMAEWLKEKLITLQNEQSLSLRLLLQLVARQAMAETPELGEKSPNQRGPQS